MLDLGFDSRCGSGAPVDWRKIDKDTTPDDDAQLPVTPRSVVEMLGFDPLDEATSAADAAEFKEAEHPRAPDGKFGKGSGGTVKPSMPKGMEHAANIQEKTVAGFAKQLISENKWSNSQIAAAAQAKFGGKTSPACIAWYKMKAKQATPEGQKAAAAKKAGVTANDTAIKAAAFKPAPSTVVEAYTKKAEAATNKTVYVSATDAFGVKQFIKLSGVPDGLDNYEDLHDALKKQGLTVNIVGKFDPSKPAPPGGYKDVVLPSVDAQAAKDAKYKQAKAQAKASGQFTELEESLSPAMLKAVKAYTDGSYSNLNMNLRKGQPMTAFQATLAAQLDAALSKAKMAEDAHVYRGVGDAAEKFFGPTPTIGTVIIDNGYVSTAKTLDKAWSGAKCKVFVPKGSRALDVQSMSLHSGEQEVLLPRGSMFKLTGIDKDGIVELEYVSR